MKIGVAGRIGMGMALFAAIADAALWIVRATDNYPFDFYRWTDACLPTLFIFGAALALPSLTAAIHNRRAASLAKFPLTIAGPLPAESSPDPEVSTFSRRTSQEKPADARDVPAPALAFVPSPSRRQLFTRIARLCLLGAVLVYVGTRWWEATRTSVPLSVPLEVLYFLLGAVGIALLFWYEVRQSEELSLQAEPRATYRGMARVGRPLIPVARVFLNLRGFSAGWFGVAATLALFFEVITPLTPRGLLVHLPRPGAYARADEPWNQPLVVRVDADRDIYLDGRPIAPSQLQPELWRAMALRPDRTVYVDGHPGADTGDVIYLVDVMRGMGITKVLLVTPRMKQERPGVFTTPPCEIKNLKPTESPFPPKNNRYGVYGAEVSFVVTERGEVSGVKLLRRLTR